METANGNGNHNPTEVQVQHVTKKSSDELLRKFADDDKGTTFRKELGVMPLPVKRRKRSGSGRPRRESSGETPSNNSLVERNRLLPSSATRRFSLVKQLGMGRSQFRGREIRNKSVFGTLEKTWRKTIEGASRVFMEKQYNRHRRLINDAL